MLWMVGCTVPAESFGISHRTGTLVETVRRNVVTLVHGPTAAMQSVRLGQVCHIPGCSLLTDIVSSWWWKEEGQHCICDCRGDRLHRGCVRVPFDDAEGE